MYRENILNGGYRLQKQRPETRLKYLIFWKLIQAGIPNLKLLDNKLN
jgi:hypothetical protein